MIVRPPIEYVHVECPVCRWDAILRFRLEPHRCPRCIADNGTGMLMLARPALPQDVPAGPDCRYPDLEAQRARRTG